MKSFQVGLLIPWVNTAMEEEIPLLVYPEIGLHWSRLRPALLPDNGHDIGYLKYLVSSVPDALSNFDGLRLQTIVFGCTSACIFDFCTEIEISSAHQNACFITAFDAILFQINKIQAKKIILFAPYEPSIIAVEVEMLKKQGISVAKAVQLNYLDEIRYIGYDQICHTFLKEYIPDYDAILFSCTALYTLEAFDYLQTKFGIRVPLISSNTAIAATLNDLYQQWYIKPK